MQVKNSFNPENRGLSHSRYLQVGEDGLEVYQHSVHGQNLKDLLLSLPPDELELINIDTTGAVSTEINGLVLRTQRNLRMQQVHVSDWPQDMPPLLLTDRVSGLVSLSLNLKDEKTIAERSSILHQLPNLKDLAIKFLSSYLKGDTHRVVRAMFNHRTAPKLKIVRLYLEFFDFKHWEGSVFVDALDLRYLKEITLLRSQGIWHVVERLSYHHLNLDSLTDDRYEDWRAVSWGISTDDLLCSFGGLKTLKRTFLPNGCADPRGAHGVSWRAVQQHSDALQILHLNDALRDEDAWTSSPNSRRSISAFRTLCGHLLRLEQLAIKPPTVEQEAWTVQSSFMEFLDCLKSVKILKSLKLLLPSLNPSGNMATDVAASLLSPAETRMQQLADVVFSELHPHCPQFTALVLSTESIQMEKNVLALWGSTSLEYRRQREVPFTPRSDSVDCGYLRKISFDQNGEKLATKLS